jgi:4'-phosphopantetheinyl transferase
MTIAAPIEGPQCQLPLGEIHAWHLVADAAAAAPVAHLLDDDERARAGRFVHSRDRDLFVATRGSLRKLLGEYLGERAERLRFAEGLHGKLALAHTSASLHFNVSHSGTRALLVFATDRAVGVDIERVESRKDALDLVPSVFTPDERARLQRTPPDERIAMFYRLWTGKEAFLKAAGGGLSIPLQNFSVTPANDLAISGVTLLDPSLPPLSVQWLSAPSGYAAALAAEGPPWQLRVFHLGDPT